MRPFILGSIAVGTIALVIGCGTKHKDSPSASPASAVPTESKPDRDEQPSPSVEEKKSAPIQDARIEATWESKLRYQPDSPPTNCAVVGRVRFFVPEKESSQEAVGTVTIELYDHTPQQGAEPLLLEEWRIDGDSLKHFLAENAASPEYNFVLPWSTYKPDIEQVRMEVKYEPKSGKMLSAKSDVLTLDRSEMKNQEK